jgi:6,7-dimethyl-8-ribityllumazine synthase
MAGKSSSSVTGTEHASAGLTAHLLVIEARYYEAVSQELLAGALAEMAASGVTHEIIGVPGALEIPQALNLAFQHGLIPKDLHSEGGRYDGCIVLGCVIRGETSHYDIVCEQANSALMMTAMDGCIPLGNAILTVNTEAQALARARGGREGKGADAVRACVALIRHSRRFEELAQDE